MRLQVQRTAASSMWFKAQSSLIALGHSASGMASFSLISTGVVWMLSPITIMLLFSLVYPNKPNQTDNI
ncbi:hypothetical protein Hanom_Chr10g00872361 [Helianthus anomalus]